MTALLCIVSVFVVAYTFVVLYRCMCTRNYAEWRSSWATSNDESSSSPIQVRFTTSSKLYAATKQLSSYPTINLLGGPGSITYYNRRPCSSYRMCLIR